MVNGYGNQGTQPVPCASPYVAAMSSYTSEDSSPQWSTASISAETHPLNDLNGACKIINAEHDTDAKILSDLKTINMCSIPEVKQNWFELQESDEHIINFQAEAQMYFKRNKTVLQGEGLSPSTDGRHAVETSTREGGGVANRRHEKLKGECTQSHRLPAGTVMTLSGT